MDEPAVTGSVQSLFKDVYETLEEIQGHADFIEPFSDAIVSCHWAISNLERIHRTHAQNPYSALAQDAFSIRGNLDRFVASCHSLIRFVNPLNLSTEAGCKSMFGGSRATLKRKQVRELQEEFWDHQRILSLVLANAIYMTTLDMQKENQIPDPELDVILRQSQKQHTVYEKTDKAGQESKSQKPAGSHVEQLEWEVCLRKYFKYVEKQVQKDQRRQSEPMLSHSGSLVRHQGRPQSGGYTQEWSNGQRHSNPVPRQKLLTYGGTDGNSYNEIYTRPRRNSTASRASSISARSRNNSISSVQSIHTVTPSTAQTSPISSGPFQWDQPSYTVNPPSRLSPPPAPEQSISRAWKDIVNATQTMSILEARAYIEGRLAGLDQNTIAEIRKAMSGSPFGSQIFTMPLSPTEPQSPREQGPATMPAPRANRPRSYGPAPVLTTSQSMPTIKTVPPVEPPTRAMSDPAKSRAMKKPNLRRKVSQKRISNLRNDHMRQLSTIVERPSTSKSRGGESIKSRKSIFSMKKEKPPPLPAKLPVPVSSDDRNPSQGSMFSDGSTLRGSTPEQNRITELEEVPEEPGPLPDIKTPNKRRSSNKDLASKPLPMTPGDFLSPAQTPSPNSSVKSRISRLFSGARSKRSNISLPSTMSSPSLLSSSRAGMKSRDTLSHMSHMSNASLECLRKGGKNGSKSTLLVAYQEGPDQPFQIWLNALPYIEGRTGERV